MSHRHSRLAKLFLVIAVLLSVAVTVILLSNRLSGTEKTFVSAILPRWERMAKKEKETSELVTEVEYLQRVEGTANWAVSHDDPDACIRDREVALRVMPSGCTEAGCAGRQEPRKECLYRYLYVYGYAHYQHIDSICGALASAYPGDQSGALCRLQQLAESGRTDCRLIMDASLRRLCESDTIEFLHAVEMGNGAHVPIATRVYPDSLGNMYAVAEGNVIRIHDEPYSSPGTESMLDLENPIFAMTMRPDHQGFIYFAGPTPRPESGGLRTAYIVGYHDLNTGFSRTLFEKNSDSTESGLGDVVFSPDISTAYFATDSMVWRAVLAESGPAEVFYPSRISKSVSNSECRYSDPRLSPAGDVLAIDYGCIEGGTTLIIDPATGRRKDAVTGYVEGDYFCGFAPDGSYFKSTVSYADPSSKLPFATLRNIRGTLPGSIVRQTMRMDTYADPCAPLLNAAGYTQYAVPERATSENQRIFERSEGPKGMLWMREDPYAPRVPVVKIDFLASLPESGPVWVYTGVPKPE